MLDVVPTATSRPFKQVDVFTTEPQRGNPLGVVLDGIDAATGDDLATDRMQRFTNWTNLSECTFVVPPTAEGRAAGADYRVRIFCPGRELPFAGHPTLGTAHAWLEAGGEPAGERIVMECGLGLVEIRRDGDRLAFAAPELLRSDPLDDDMVERIATGLGLERSEIVAHRWCDNGPLWQGVLLESAERVLAIEPDVEMLAGLDIGVVGPHPEGSDIAFELRAFFPGNNGLTEDPVTGSLNAAVAQWLIGEGLAPSSYVAAQGTRLDRRGRIHVEADGEAIWIGGSSITCVDGTVVL